VYDEDLSNLDEWIRRLKVEYDIFFNGNRKKPPDDLRLRVEKLVKRLSEATDMSSSQRFRYTTLISKFYVHRDLWRRTQQDRESSEGYANGLPRAQQELDLPQPPSVREVQVSISAPEREGEKYTGSMRSFFVSRDPIQRSQQPFPSSGSPITSRNTLEASSGSIIVRL